MTKTESQNLTHIKAEISNVRGCSIHIITVEFFIIYPWCHLFLISLLNEKLFYPLTSPHLLTFSEISSIIVDLMFNFTLILPQLFHKLLSSKLFSVGENSSFFCYVRANTREYISQRDVSIVMRNFFSEQRNFLTVIRVHERIYNIKVIIHSIVQDWALVIFNEHKSIKTCRRVKKK